MATLNGRTPGDTFGNLLQVDNSNNGIDGTLRDLEDGEGTVGPVQLSTTGVRVKNGVTFDFASGGIADFDNATINNLKTWKKLDQIAPSSGSSTQVTGLPSGTVAVLIVFSDMDYSTNTRVRMQVMDDSVVQTSGYQCTSTIYNNSTTLSIATSSSVLHMARVDNTDGTNLQSGTGLLTKNGTTGRWTWHCFGRLSDSATPTNYAHTVAIGESPTISGTMNGLEFETNTGNFSSGTITRNPIPYLILIFFTAYDQNFFTLIFLGSELVEGRSRNSCRKTRSGSSAGSVSSSFFSNKMSVL
jgi:hypothetical protein